MEKQVFLDRVRETLLHNGLTEEAAERQIHKLSRYIDEEGGANTAAMLEEEDPVLLAEEICAILKRNAAQRAAQLPREEEICAETVTETEAPATHEMQIEPDVIPMPSTVQELPVQDYVAPESVYLPPRVEENRPTGKKSARKKKKKHDREMLEIDAVGSRAVEYAGNTGGPLFWTIFLVSLPFVAAICLAILAAFLACFLSLTVLIIVSMATMIVVAAVGTAFTLVALIYGIVQALSTLPIGLFEIGIGITAGAVVLFTSILLYNFAIRLLPFAMKQLARFFGWTVRRGKVLFIYLKGECAKL